jgi:hypothetical protein
MSLARAARWFAANARAAENVFSSTAIGFEIRNLENLAKHDSS